jgi:tRNA-dihydrouridine synthase
MPPIIHFAPLHGVTNRIFRRAFFSHFTGFDAAMAPFIGTLKTIPDRNRHFRDLLPENNTGLTIIPQLLGNEPEDFVVTGQILADLGYTEVNWNLGCPYARVAKKRRGSGLLPHPGLIRRVLETACSRLPIQVSVKLRLGRTDPAEIFDLLPIFNDLPLKRIILHPRTGIQMYDGAVDLGGFAAAAGLSRHPVMYNGDITSLAAFKSLQGRFPAISEWMIGRWAISNPLLIGQIRGEAPESDPLGRVRAFHDELQARYAEVLSGPGHLMDKMKELWRYLDVSFPENPREILGIARAKTLEEYIHAAGTLLKNGVWKPK